MMGDMTAGIPAVEEARIRQTVARHYRSARRFESSLLIAALRERDGWARLVADEYADQGTVHPTTVLYFIVAREYVEAAQRLGERRAAKRRAVAA